MGNTVHCSAYRVLAYIAVWKWEAFVDFSNVGLASPTEYYRAFYGERRAWWLVIKATGAPGHGAKLYDNTAMENLLKSIESVRRFRASQFDMVKAGLKAEGEVISVNMVSLKAGTPSPSVSSFLYHEQQSLLLRWIGVISQFVSQINLERSLDAAFAHLHLQMQF